MVAVSTTQLSSRGQVVIPEEIRTRLGLKPGSRFVVVAGRGVVIFKTIDAPELGDFDALVSAARKKARRAGMRKRDVGAAIRRARGRG
jgi:AbrB family looped-hinge helix DNA binding protein